MLSNAKSKPNIEEKRSMPHNASQWLPQKGAAADMIR